jgi:hypothetical protein
MAYAMWTKISSALLLDVRAFAAAEGVDEALVAEWAISQPGVADRSELTASGVAPKAWRFVAEMDQMATSSRDVGFPDGFAVGAADIYRRLAGLKDTDPAAVDLVRVIDALRK